MESLSSLNEQLIECKNELFARVSKERFSVSSVVVILKLMLLVSSCSSLAGMLNEFSSSFHDASSYC